MKKAKKPLSATIRFSGKKATTKKEFKKIKIIETWELTDYVSSKEYFTYNGNRYQLMSTVEKEIETPSN